MSPSSLSRGNKGGIKMQRLEDMTNEERAVFLVNSESNAAKGPFALVGGIGICAFAGWALTQDIFLGFILGICGIIITLAGAYWTSSGKEGVTRYKAFEKQQPPPQYYQTPVERYPSAPSNPSQYYPPPPPPTEPYQSTSPKTNGKFCPYCGTNNPPDYNYCNNCQKPLS